jgi:hypothetical protein
MLSSFFQSISSDRMLCQYSLESTACETNSLTIVTLIYSTTTIYCQLNTIVVATSVFSKSVVAAGMIDTN